MAENEIRETDIKKMFLRRYRKNRANVRRLEKKINILDERIKTVRSTRFSDMPRGGTPIMVEDMIAEKDDLERRKKRLQEKGKIIKTEITDKIDEIDDSRYAEILEAFFIDCKNFDEIADDNNYTIRHIMRLYREAINSMSL